MTKTKQRKKAESGVSHLKDRIAVSVSYPQDVAVELRDIARQTGRSLSGLIRFISAEYVKEKKNKLEGVSHLN